MCLESEGLQFAYDEAEKRFNSDLLTEKVKKLRLATQNRVWPKFQKVIRDRSLKDHLGENEYFDRLIQAQDFLNELSLPFINVTGSTNSDEDFRGAIWNHRSLQETMAPPERLNYTFLNTDKMLIQYESLLDVVASYLGRPWLQHDEIDWIFLDSLIYAEIERFRESVYKGEVTGKTNWFYLLAEGDIEKSLWMRWKWEIGLWALRYLIPISAIGTLLYLEFEKSAMALGIIYAVYQLGRLVLWPRRYFQKKQLQEKLNETEKVSKRIFSVYHFCQLPILSPSTLREQLRICEKENISFNGAVYAIVDRILARDKAVFIPVQEN